MTSEGYDSIDLFSLSCIFLFACITKEEQKIRIIYQRAARHDANRRIDPEEKGEGS